MSYPERRVAFPAETPERTAELLYREWLLTNGLGGYANGTICGVQTRRYHGLLVSALAAPFGRTMMLNELSEQLRLPDGSAVRLGGDESKDRDPGLPAGGLVEFRLETGLPVWRYEAAGFVLEKRVVMPHRQNTVYVIYRLVEGAGPVTLELYPALHFRGADASVSMEFNDPYAVTMLEDRYEFQSGDYPPLRMMLCGHDGAFTVDRRRSGEIMYRIEASRGYDARGELWSPGYFHVDLGHDRTAALIASTERLERMTALTPAEAIELELERRRHLLATAGMARRADAAAELVLAADQFLITPAGRVEDSARARAAGYEVRTVIAGYHWFTDWGRDTMISLEGLTLCTGRYIDGGSLLRSFAYYVKDGLIPNLFPEGGKEGLYHTADATLWFFHALARYVAATGDRGTLRLILPKLIDIVQHHLRGTHFGIGVDATDGLLRQGREAYQLTWMDAKVDDWVVTPRRGKAVEINALWYNALRLLEGWLRDEQGERQAHAVTEHADRVYEAFNRRFWYGGGGYLYDVVDGENGDDTSLRPNQVLAIALDHPVLDPARWTAVMEIVARRLLTPVGLRTLDPAHPDYKRRYDGDLRARDAAYHQGTVWPWLLGPFVDAWLKIHPGDRAGARAFVEPLLPQLAENCIGTLPEIFDAEAPYHPRGCVAQAWSVAEVLRVLHRTAPAEGP